MALGRSGSGRQQPVLNESWYRLLQGDRPDHLMAKAHNGSAKVLTSEDHRCDQAAWVEDRASVLAGP